jgi:hypothetical protein
MQIHELTHPRKTKLDEFDVVGPDSVFLKTLSAIKNPKSLVSRHAAAASARDRYNSYGQKAYDDFEKKLKKNAPSLIRHPDSLATSLKKFKASPTAQKWVNDTVAKWPAVADTITPVVTIGKQRLGPNDPNYAATLAAMAKQGIKEAAEYTTPGGIVVPANSKTAQTKQALKSWINNQLQTTTLEKVDDVPGLKAQLDPLIDQVVSKAGNISAQQEDLRTILSLATAGNNVVSPPEQPGLGQAQKQPGTTETPAVDLSPENLYKLKKQARAAGGPRPAKTDNAFLNALIDKIWGY